MSHRARPVGEPADATIDTCEGCGQRVTRLGLDDAQWRHDNGSTRCPLDEPTFDELLRGPRERGS